VISLLGSTFLPRFHWGLPPCTLLHTALLHTHLHCTPAHTAAYTTSLPATYCLPLHSTAAPATHHSYLDYFCLTTPPFSPLHCTTTYSQLLQIPTSVLELPTTFLGTHCVLLQWVGGHFYHTFPTAPPLDISGHFWVLPTTTRLHRLLGFWFSSLISFLVPAPPSPASTSHLCTLPPLTFHWFMPLHLHSAFLPCTPPHLVVVLDLFPDWFHYSALTHRFTTSPTAFTSPFSAPLTCTCCTCTTLPPPGSPTTLPPPARFTLPHLFASLFLPWVHLPPLGSFSLQVLPTPHCLGSPACTAIATHHFHLLGEQLVGFIPTTLPPPTAHHLHSWVTLHTTSTPPNTAPTPHTHLPTTLGGMLPACLGFLHHHTPGWSYYTLVHLFHVPHHYISALIP